MISIIIPVYNQAKKIKTCLKSILEQTLNDFEVIIVNDGSTDEIKKTIAEFTPYFKNKNITLKYFNQENEGAPSARNKGFKESKGEYLLFCDADTVLNNNFLEKTRNFLEASLEASYVYTSFYWGKKLFSSYDFDSEKLKKNPYIHTMALIRRSDFPISGWDESIKKFQDWDLFLTMLEEKHIGIRLSEPLFKVFTGGTMSDWLPTIAYKIFPFLPSVKKYNRAMKIIESKHKLN